MVAPIPPLRSLYSQWKFWSHSHFSQQLMIVNQLTSEFEHLHSLLLGNVTTSSLTSIQQEQIGYWKGGNFKLVKTLTHICEWAVVELSI